MAGRNQEFQADLEPVTAQVAAAYHNVHGGSSFFAHGGHPARKGYAVGGSGVPEATINAPQISSNDYQAHRDHIRALNPSDPHLVTGSWVEDGKSVLDASSVVGSKKQASRLQKQRGERAVYDISRGKELDLR